MDHVYLFDSLGYFVFAQNRILHSLFELRQEQSRRERQTEVVQAQQQDAEAALERARRGSVPPSVVEGDLSLITQKRHDVALSQAVGTQRLVDEFRASRQDVQSLQTAEATAKEELYRLGIGIPCEGVSQ